MSYSTEALALRADYSRSKTVTKTYFEWLWCWIIPSSGGEGEPWREFIRAVRNCIAKSPWGVGMLLWQLCAALQDLLLQPCGDTEMECGPGTTALLGHLHRAIRNSPLSNPSPSPLPSLWILCWCSQAIGWVSVFLPWTHVHKLEQVSLSAGSVLPCPEFLFPWDLRCNGNTATAGNRPQASHQCHKAKGFFWLWFSSWLAWSLVQL